MKVEVLSSINDIGASEWNALVGRNRMICRHEYLRAVEASRINDCRCFYPVVYEKGVLAAHACVYFISTELDTFAQGFVKEAIQKVRRAWGGFLVMRTVECGSPVGLGSTVSFREGADAGSALQQIVRETERLAGTVNASAVFFRDFHDHELSLYDGLQAAGYRRVRNLPCARLEVRWDSFEEYVDSMRSQYRCKLLAQVRKFQAAGGTVERVDRFSPHAQDLAWLWRNTYDHAREYRREVLLPDYFENVERFMDGRSSVLLARVEGRPAGFLLLLMDDDVLTTLFAGLDYGCSRESGVYFNLFYEAVRLAIVRGVREIDFGITCLAPKLDLGAVVVPLHMYMKHRNPLGNQIIPRVFERMSPQIPFSSRHVFKS